MITLQQFIDGVPCTPNIARVWHPLIDRAMEENEINTPLRIAGFLAQMSIECKRFTTFQENMNYSVDGLARTWPSRFAVDPRAKVKEPNALAWKLGRINGTQPCDQRALANHVYGDRYGNRPGTDDGWNFRGRGPKQITFSDNYRDCGKALKLDLLTTPDLLLIPENGANSAVWYWTTRNCNEAMDREDFTTVTHRINGGLNGHEDGNKVGLDDRVEVYVHLKTVLGIA